MALKVTHVLFALQGYLVHVYMIKAICRNGLRAKPYYSVTVFTCSY